MIKDDIGVKCSLHDTALRGKGSFHIDNTHTKGCRLQNVLTVSGDRVLRF